MPVLRSATAPSARPFAPPSMKRSRSASTPSRESSRRQRRRWLGAILLLLFAIALFVVEKTTDFDWRSVPRTMEHLPTGLVLPLTAILPLFGFPISIVYLVLGARFGPGVGLIIVAGVTLVHVVGTWWISQSLLRDRIERWLARRQHHIPHVPPGEENSVTVLAVLAPALPYFIRNYALGLSGIPLRTLLLIGVPLYTARSAVALYLGELSAQPSVHGFVILGAIYAAKLGICAAIVWRMRRHHKLRQSAV